MPAIVDLCPCPRGMADTATAPRQAGRTCPRLCQVSHRVNRLSSALRPVENTPRPLAAAPSKPPVAVVAVISRCSAIDVDPVPLPHPSCAVARKKKKTCRATSLRKRRSRGSHGTILRWMAAWGSEGICKRCASPMRPTAAAAARVLVLVSAVPIARPSSCFKAVASHNRRRRRGTAVVVEFRR